MDALERTFKYAEAHLNKADRLLAEAEKLRQELRENVEDAESNYRNAIMRGKSMCLLILCELTMNLTVRN